jgi:hypothetical protein
VKIPFQTKPAYGHVTRALLHLDKPAADRMTRMVSGRRELLLTWKMPFVHVCQLYLADWLAGLCWRLSGCGQSKRVSEQQAAYLVSTLQDSLNRWEGEIEDAGASKQAAPVYKLALIDYRYACANGWSHFLDIETFEMVKELPRLGVTQLSCDLGGLLLDHLQRLPAETEA